MHASTERAGVHATFRLPAFSILNRPPIKPPSSFAINRSGGEGGSCLQQILYTDRTNARLED